MAGTNLETPAAASGGHGPARLREPFRLFFPFAVLLGVAGVAPWVLVWQGSIKTWPSAYHAGVMTQAFLVAVATGFLGTMAPRRAGAPPMGPIEAALLAAGLAAVAVALAAGAPRAAQLGYLAVLGTLGLFLLRRRRRRRRAGDAPPQPSFVLLPIALGLGIAGALAMLLAPAAVAAMGRQIVEQGFLLGLVLALVPMLTPNLVAPQETPRPRGRGFYALAGIALAASFPLELASTRAGLLLRAAACAVPLLSACPPWARRTRAGFHRGLFRLASGLIPLGLLAGALVPARRIPLLHVTFVSGLYLIVVAVTAHVVMLHTGRDRLAERRPWPLVVAAALALAATAARVAADRIWWHYFELLALAAALWLASALVWGAFVLVMTTVPASPDRRAAPPS